MLCVHSPTFLFCVANLFNALNTFGTNLFNALNKLLQVFAEYAYGNKIPLWAFGLLY